MRIFEYKFYIQKIIRVYLISNKKQKEKNSLKIIHHHQQVFVYLHWKSFLEIFMKDEFPYKNNIEKI